MRRFSVLAAAGAMVMTGVAPATAGPADSEQRARAAHALGGQVASKVTKLAAKPRGANPYLALLPDPSTVDFRGWQAYVEQASKAKAERRARQQARAFPVPPHVLVDEDEPRGVRGSNDTPDTAQLVAGFGTGPGEDAGARILGSMSIGRTERVRIRPNRENDGSIPLARNTRIGQTRDGIRTSGRIGDGPHGRARSGRGDFDFYKVGAEAGDVIQANTATPRGNLDSMLVIWNADGEPVAFNDDTEQSLDSLIRYTVPADGDYYVMVTGFFSVPNNPFRSGSGTGASSQGRYGLRIGLIDVDTDYYAVNLRPGDVLGATVSGSATSVSITDPDEVLVQGSEFDASFIRPMASPLPGGGNAAAEHVADEAGLHYVSVSGGRGSYDLTVEAYRPGLEGNGAEQTLFLDFDGGRINTGVFGGFGQRELSPLSAFLGRWGLTRADEDAVIDAIIAEVEENLESDLVAAGLEDDFAITLLNSRDDADPWGQDDVSRIVVGGTIEESGVFTIGIAQSIDPGNFETEESALVLLDILSSDDEEFGDASLNFYLNDDSDRVGFVGQAVGNVVAHEAGHFFGNWHVDQFNDVANLMDQGGNFPVLYGVGDDMVGGTADDPDVDFGEDTFNPNEIFTGLEDTLSRIATTLVS